MDLKLTINNWDKLGREDPFWAVLTESNKKDGRWKKREFFNSGKLEINDLIQELEKSKISINYDKALDFGSGVGRLTQALAKYFIHVVGVDASQSMVSTANTLNRKNNIEFILNKNNNLKLFKNHTFDFIYSNKTLQHIPPEYSIGYIKELLRILKQKGVMVFYLPSKPAWNIKGLLIRIIPGNLLDILRGDGLLGLLKFIFGMEVNRFGMYGIIKQDVVNFLTRNGAQILDIKHDRKSGNGWEFYRYCVRM